MNWITRQWNGFRKKSLWGKFWDVLFVAVIALLIVPDGRIFVQHMLLKTGLLGGTDMNMEEKLRRNSTEWELVNLEGESFTFSELNNRTVFLNFWATWCPPCKAEIPSIVELMDITGIQVQFILVTNEQPDHVRRFLESEGLDLPVYFPRSNTPTQLQAESLPTTYVISADGTIIHKSEGMRDWASEEAVELVGGKIK